MSNINFDDVSGRNNGSVLYSRLKYSSNTPKIINFLMKTGIVKDEKKAGVLLLIIAIVLLIVSFFMFNYGVKNTQVPSVESVINSVIKK